MAQLAARLTQDQKVGSSSLSGPFSLILPVPFSQTSAAVPRTLAAKQSFMVLTEQHVANVSENFRCFPGISAVVPGISAVFP